MPAEPGRPLPLVTAENEFFWTSGADGQLSHGRTHGMALIHEAMVQLRGEGGARQVPNASVAVAAPAA